MEELVRLLATMYLYVRMWLMLGLFSCAIVAARTGLKANDDLYNPTWVLMCLLGGPATAIMFVVGMVSSHIGPEKEGDE